MTMSTIPDVSRLPGFRHRAARLCRSALLAALCAFAGHPAAAAEGPRPPAEGPADCDGDLFRPGAGVAFRLADRSTNADPSTLGLTVLGTDGERARGAAEAALRGLTLLDAGGKALPFTPRTVPGEAGPAGDVRLRLDVLRPAWEPGWYELRLALSDPGIGFVQETPSRPGGAHALRFRIGSEPLLRAARVCVKADGRRMVALDLSEPLEATAPNGGDPASLALDGGAACTDPAAPAAGRPASPLPRRDRLYRLCPPQGEGATLKWAAPFAARRELRWSLPVAAAGDAGPLPCRDLPVE
jgi:hypothetical protein